MSETLQAYRGDDAYAFVCYAHADASVVYAELKRLQENGANLWFDEGISAGSVWRGEIANAIRSAEKFLFFVSDSSLGSEHCLREVEYALDKGVEIVPIYIAQTELPPSLDLALGRIQALTLSSETYDAKIARVLKFDGIPQRAPVRRNSWVTIAGVIFAAVLLLIVLFTEWGRDQPAVKGDPSVAVLPLKNLSAEYDNFGEAVAREIWSKLAQVEGLRTISMTSAARFANSELPIQEIGEQLTANYIVEGSVLRSESTVRVNIHLSSSLDGSSLWTTSYTKTLDSADALFTLFDEITAELGEAFPAHILGLSRLNLPTKQTTTDIVAYDLLQKAEDAIQYSDYPTGIALVERALEVDPMYVDAWSELGRMQMLAAEWGYGRPKPLLEAANRSLQRAIEIDPNWGNAHVYLGFVIDRLELDSRKARASMERGRALGSDPEAYASAADGILLPAGRYEEAVIVAEAAVSRNPGDGWYRLSVGRLYLRMGRISEALHEFDLALEMSPTDPSVLSEVYFGLSELGQFDRIRKMLAESPIDTSILRCWLELEEGNPGPMRSYVDKAIANWENEYTPTYEIQSGLFALGDYDGYMEWTRRRIEERDSVSWLLVYLQRDPQHWEKLDAWATDPVSGSKERVEKVKDFRKYWDEVTANLGR